MSKSNRYIRWFGDLGLADVPIVGGKNASLGELYRELSPLGVSVPNGFAITAEAFRDTLREAGLGTELEELMKTFDKRGPGSLETETLLDPGHSFPVSSHLVSVPMLAGPGRMIGCLDRFRLCQDERR